MNKKLMILVAGALTALAFMALAGAASAKETKLKCEGSGECEYTIHGNESRFSLTGGDTVWCSTVVGKGVVTGLDAERESTTSNVELTFSGCKEQATIFHFACTSAGQASGTVTTNTMVAHNIALTSGTKAGVLLTDATVTFTCAGGFASTQVTGNIIGEYEKECGPTSTGTVQKVEFGTPETTPHGSERLKTYTGVTYDLEGKTSHTGGGGYETAAQTGTGTLTFNQNVELTCA